jgi:opacity protein-like surface antigen
MIRLAVIAVVILASTPAWSQDYARDGFAIGAGGSYALEDFDDGDFNFDNAGAVDAFASYRFHPHFGVEARFEQTFNFDGNADFADVDVDVWSLTANLQYFILTEQFQPYIGAGFGIGEATVDVDTPFGSEDDDVTDPMARFTAGLDSYVTPNFVVGVEVGYNLGIDDLDDFNYWSFSALLRYRF